MALLAVAAFGLAVVVVTSQAQTAHRAAAMGERTTLLRLALVAKEAAVVERSASRPPSASDRPDLAAARGRTDTALAALIDRMSTAPMASAGLVRGRLIAARTALGDVRTGIDAARAQAGELAAAAADRLSEIVGRLDEAADHLEMAAAAASAGPIARGYIAVAARCGDVQDEVGRQVAGITASGTDRRPDLGQLAARAGYAWDTLRDAKAVAARIAAGHGWTPATAIGPMVDAARLAYGDDDWTERPDPRAGVAGLG